VARLHVVTDDRVLGLDGFRARAREVLEAGGRRIALHVRAPAAGGARMFAAVRELLEPARMAGATLLVNDRVDVALVLGVDGVHLGERSLGPAEARRLLGPAPLVGASVHRVEAAGEAADGGVDYLVVGTVFATRSNPGRPGAGADLLRRVRSAVAVPVLAIGGVGIDRVSEVRAAGAHGVAVLSGVWDAPSPAEAVERYLSALNE
jgi:thiamine-phosphate diphosphorylase